MLLLTHIFWFSALLFWVLIGAAAAALLVALWWMNIVRGIQNDGFMVSCWNTAATTSSHVHGGGIIPPIQTDLNRLQVADVTWLVACLVNAP